METSIQFEDALRTIVDCVRIDYPGAEQVDVVIHSGQGEYVMTSFLAGNA